MSLVLIGLLVGLVCANADEYGTTDAGRRVLLRDNGTWVNVSANPVTRSAPDSSGDTEQILTQKCRADWPTDFRMQAFCEKQQRELVQALAQGRPQDISEDQYAIVRNKCTGDWPSDYRMRAFCERQQFEAIRQLRK